MHGEHASIVVSHTLSPAQVENRHVLNLLFKHEPTEISPFNPVLYLIFDDEFKNNVVEQPVKQLVGIARLSTFKFGATFSDDVVICAVNYLDVSGASVSGLSMKELLNAELKAVNSKLRRQRRESTDHDV